MFASFLFFGSSHLTVLAIILFLVAVSIFICRKNASSLTAKAVLALLTFSCLIVYPMNQAVLSAIGGPHLLDALLPFHLCDYTVFICGFALITRKPLLCELAYFWGLTGTLQGLLTPNLSHDFPSPIFITFFFQHGVIVITSLVLPLALNWRPRPKAVLRCLFLAIIYAAVTMPINYMLNTNFGFIMRKPDQASLLDFMGPWPWYILALIAITWFIFFLLNLPFKKSILEQSKQEKTK